MADFVAVLRKTIDGLADNTPAMREKVYEKARATVAAKLAAISPPPAAAVADRQKQVLEDAISQVEAGYAGRSADPFAELENVFAEPKEAPKPVQAKPVPPPPSETKAPPSLIASTPSPQPVLPGDRVEPQAWGPAAERVETFAPIAPARPGVPFDGEEEDQVEDDEIVFEEPERQRRNFTPLIAAVVVLVLLAGGGYAVWLNKDDFMAMVGIGGNDTVATAPATSSDAPAADGSTPAVQPPASATKSSADAPAEEGSQKFTQRLNDDGSEVDEGPANGIASIGEGTTVAAATTPSTPPVLDTVPPAADPAVPADGTAPADTADPADAAAPADATDPAAATGDATAAADPAAPADVAAPADASAPADATAPADAAAATGPAASTATSTTAPASDQVAVGQKAIFYEERTAVAEGSAESGSVVWSLVQESPGADKPPEAAIRGEATIPGKNIQLRMTIRRNVDKTLPASHTIELIFLTPDNFDGGGIENILRFALKGTEEAAGNPLLGIPVKITDGFFLVALNDSKAEVETNLTLLRREQWIDVPLIYKSGRRALFTMEKGVPGDKVFDEAVKAWQTATASAG